MPRWKNNGAFFTPIRLHRALKKSKRTVGSPTRTTKARLRGQRVIGELLLNVLSFAIIFFNIIRCFCAIEWYLYIFLLEETGLVIERAEE